MTWKGNGLFLWQVVESMPNKNVKPNTQAGWDHIVNILDTNKIDYVMVKVTNGLANFNKSKGMLGWNDDIVQGLYKTLYKSGRERIGWGYFYGYDGELNIAAGRIIQLGLTKFVVDAEGEYKTVDPGKAERLMAGLIERCPGVEFALTSYRYPNLHPEFPWASFLKHMRPGVDVHMPQVYWQASYAENAGSKQLKDSWTRLRKLKPLDVVPVGPCFGAQDGDNYWAPTSKQMDGFVDMATELKCPAIAWWEMSNMLRPDFLMRGYMDRMKRYTYQMDLNGVPLPPPQPLTLEEQVQRLVIAHPELFPEQKTQP